MTLRPLSFIRITALLLANFLWPAANACQQQSQQNGESEAAMPIPGASVAAADAGALPDAPKIAAPPGQSNAAPSNAPNSSPAAQVSDNRQQTKRILYIIPNFRAVSADQHLPPQTVKEKFKTATLDSVDYSSFIFVGIQAGVAQARNSTPEFHQGVPAYGRYYWHTYADYVDENLWVEFILPAALRQDPRYYTLGHGSFAKRFAYSVSRIAITRTDSGHSAFNASEIFGAGAASGISCLYYPTQERTLSKTFQLWMTNLAIDGGSSLFKEFWPDINDKLFHQKN
jgi:hypothetical protein